MNKYLLLILSILLANCASKDKDNYTYFGGKIINPKSDFVLLYKKHKLIDSIKLTNKNTFMSKLKNIKPGLYFFKHGLEHQYVYLEPKDSLLIRLNTWGFDESLVFSGTSSEKNNVLIETFSQNEEDDKEFLEYYKLNTKEFKRKIDSTKQEKDKILTEFKHNNPNLSKDFITILDIALTYPVYTKSENFVRENSIKTIPEIIDNSFLSHRKESSINKDSLMFYIPYRNYVYAHLYSDIFKKQLKKNSNAFTIALLKNINSKITSEKQRNRLLKHITTRDFYNRSNGNINKETFDIYFSLSTNEKDKKIIKDLIQDIKKIKKSEKTPSFTLRKANGELTEIETLIKDKKTLIYFKGKTKCSDEWLSSRLNYLIKKNKNTQFLIVNNNDQFIHKLNIEYQYSLNKESKAYNFLNCRFPRVLLINKKGFIENSFASLSSDKIEKQISDL